MLNTVLDSVHTLRSQEVTMDLYFSPLACSMATRIAFLRGRRRRYFIGVDTIQAARRWIGLLCREPHGSGAGAAH